MKIRREIEPFKVIEGNSHITDSMIIHVWYIDGPDCYVCNSYSYDRIYKFSFDTKEEAGLVVNMMNHIYLFGFMSVREDLNKFLEQGRMQRTTYDECGYEQSEIYKKYERPFKLAFEEGANVSGNFIHNLLRR